MACVILKAIQNLYKYHIMFDHISRISCTSKYEPVLAATFCVSHVNACFVALCTCGKAIRHCHLL